MRRLLATTGFLVLLVIARDPARGAPRTAKTVAAVPVPRGSRAQEDGTIRSSQGFRDTVRYYRRHLERTGAAHREVPTYRRGDTTVARFLATSPQSAWLAIHVFLRAGQTQIVIVPRPSAPPRQPP